MQVGEVVVAILIVPLLLFILLPLHRLDPGVLLSLLGLQGHQQQLARLTLIHAELQ